MALELCKRFIVVSNRTNTRRNSRRKKKHFFCRPKKHQSWLGICQYYSTSVDACVILQMRIILLVWPFRRLPLVVVVFFVVVSLVVIFLCFIGVVTVTNAPAKPRFIINCRYKRHAFSPFCTPSSSSAYIYSLICYSLEQLSCGMRYSLNDGTFCTLHHTNIPTGETSVVFIRKSWFCKSRSYIF